MKALVSWRDEDITVSPFSLYYTWRNNLRLYNRMILAIIIMFVYSGIVVIGEPWILICHPPVSFVPSALRRAQMTLSGGNSKSAGFKWQKCRVSEHYIINITEVFHNDEPCSSSSTTVILHFFFFFFFWDWNIEAYLEPSGTSMMDLLRLSILSENLKNQRIFF